MSYKDFTLGDWIGHISIVIEAETTLDGNEMRDLVELLTTMQESKTDMLDKIRAEISKTWHTHPQSRYEEGLKDQALRDMKIIDRYRIESEDT